MVDLGGHTLIVTGFPRSGTSMMMRILSFGGIDIVADELLMKPQHKHDPHGCLELENVGSDIKQSAPEETENKAVKIVAPYADWFPIDRPLKAIFMQRDLNEIVTSLLAMRAVWEVDVAETIEWARGYLAYNEVPTLFVKYKEALGYPKTTALMIQDFLGAELDVDNMAKAVDRDARNRYKKDKTLAGHDVPEHIIRMDSEAYEDLSVETFHTHTDAAAIEAMKASEDADG